MENSRFHHQSLIGNFIMNKLVLSTFVTLAILMARVSSSPFGTSWGYPWGGGYRSTDNQGTVQVRTLKNLSSTYIVLFKNTK